MTSFQSISIKTWPVIGLFNKHPAYQIWTETEVTPIVRIRLKLCVRDIGLIRDSRHVGFQIVMQISHVLCWGGGGGGANIGKKANCGKSAHRNIEITLIKVHFGI